MAVGLWLLGGGAEQKKGGGETGGWSGTGTSVGTGPAEEGRPSQMREREVEGGRRRGGGEVEEIDEREVERGRRGRE